ncbi:hypothetical protein ACPCHT_28390 [Nucisporomicrobium flavum]|uniref:hypothetical protein n=1 Tax=Nucisporomicrobium flavum TaxID=2785915 RepID=UPI003C2CD1C6
MPERHERLIARTREVCAADDRLAAALMYGSFATGEGDEHSDIEFWLFFAEDPGDERAWIERIAPVTHVVRNEFGSHVAFFPGLIRGEFHFARVADIAAVAEWPVSRIVPIVDRHGLLPEPAGELDTGADVCGRFANWLLLAYHVGERGERLRQLDALAHAQRHLLWMSRLAEGRTEHWLTPSRRAEAELGAATLAALGRTHEDVGAAWRAGRALWLELDPAPPGELFAELDRALGA